MKIAIIALGTRGDVQPYIALGKGLKEAGHVVRLITNENYKVLVNSHGLEFCGVQGNVQEVTETEEIRQLLEKGNFIAIMSQMGKKAEKAAIGWAEQGLTAAKGVELLIAGIGGLYVGVSLAQKLGIPFLQAYLLPFTPTKAFPTIIIPQWLSSLGGSFNHLSHSLFRQFMWQGFRKADTLARQKILDLPAAPFWGPYNAEEFHRYPILYGFSPSVIPQPSDWNNHTHVTGYWFLDSASDWKPPSELIKFLESGSTPFYIGFGSMGNRKPEETVDLVLQALEQTQQRAILLSGWGGLSKTNLPNNVFMVDSIPHSWLFPRVAAVVHHGGAGTTAAGLRAGVPSIIIPFFGDQPFWGNRVAKLGVGPKPIPRKQLTAQALARAIQKVVTDKTISQRAMNLGSKIQAEDGVAKAVAVIQEIERYNSLSR